MWTRFMDMSSGGGQKEDFDYIYIEAPRDEAEIIFYNIFGHNPNRVTCTCCGADYSIDEGNMIEQVTAYERGCKYDKSTDKFIEEDANDYREYIKLEDYIKKDNVKFIYANDIKNEDREGELPEQGYVWV